MKNARIVLFPGFTGAPAAKEGDTLSATDSGFVSAKHLAALYGVRVEDCVVYPAPNDFTPEANIARQQWNHQAFDLNLMVRPDGQYKKLTICPNTGRPIHVCPCDSCSSALELNWS